MTRSRNPFFEFWRSQKERGALLRRVDQLRLNPLQLRELLDSSGVRAELKNTRMASLLPPVGTDVFRRFTSASSEKIQTTVAEKTNHLKPTLHLEAGKPLPFVYGVPPPQLVNTAVEELDPFYQSQKTFIVLDKENIIHRFNAESSCYLLSPFSSVRTIAIKILLSLYVFTAIYTFEVMVKVASMGFCVGRFTFLRNPWNWLDLMAVIIGFLRLLSRFVNLEKASVLIVVSLSLKLIAIYPGMRKTAQALIQSVKKLAGVFLLTICGLSILALIGLQLFMGNLRHKCTMSFSSTDVNVTFDVQSHIEDPVNHYYRFYGQDALLCGNVTQAGGCPEGYVCMRAGKNPNYGFTNFDSFGWSLLSLFRLMTQDFWENLLQMVLRAAGKPYVILFALIFLPGCFCMVSLLLAAVTVLFVDQDKAGITEAKQKEEEFLQIQEVLKIKDSAQEHKTEGTEKLDRRIQEHTEESEQNPGWWSTCWHAFAECCLKWNCCDCWRRFKQLLQAFVMNPFFDFGIFLCIIINTIIMALEHYPMTANFEAEFTITNLVFTLVFIVEMILRLLATDPYGYFKMGWNIFDFIIIFGSIFHIFIYDFVLFELLRVFRLGRWWPTLSLWIKIIWTSVRAQRNLILILCIVVFNSSVIGLQLFGKDYMDNIHLITLDSQLPRWHMHDFFHSFMLVVRILCGEWIETLWDCMAVSCQTTCLIFYLTVLFIGNLLILNLFLALLLSSFRGDYLIPAEKEKNNIQIAINHIKKALGIRSCRDPKVDSKEDKEGLALSADQNLGFSRAPITETKLDFKTSENEEDDEEKQQCNVEQKPSEAQPDKDNEDQKINTPEASCCSGCYRCCPFLDVDTSGVTGRVWSNFRTACLVIADHKYFEIVLIFIILLSSIALVFEDMYLQQSQHITAALDKADQVFAYLFLLEMVIKWTALGLKKYFRSFWCWLDFLILVVSLMAITAGMLGWTELGAGLSLRTLRTLRPLRILSRFQGPKVVLEALAVTLRSMWSVLMVILVVWLFFSLVGVHLLAGKFNYCYNETSDELMTTSVVNNKTDCLLLMQNYANASDIRWKSPYINFDNVGIGYLALLQMATFKGWLDIMYSAVDSRWVEDQPLYEDNIYMYLYLIWFIVFGCFVTFNLFFRVIMDKLDLQGHKFGGKHFFMTDEQQKYSRTMAKLFFKTPVKSSPRPQNHCQARLFDLVTNPFFEVFMVVLICLNMVILMVDTVQQSVEKEIILFWLRFTFLFIYFIEFLLKIISLGKNYFTSGWNILDFVVLVAYVISLFIADLVAMYFILPSLFPVLRMAHICRILQHFRCTRRIRALLLAFVTSLPALFNICFLLFVLMFTYSIFGMVNFAYVKKGAMLDDMLNFETFANSFICMFVITTRAGWDGVLFPFLIKEPDCDPDIENPGSTIRGNCGSPGVGIIFCTSYVLLSLLLVVQLYIAVILEIFNTGSTENLSDDNLKTFYNTWKEFDPSASQVIQYSQMSDLCDSLQDPLRIPKPNSIKLAQMDLPLLPGDKIHCLDVLMALTAQAFGEAGEKDALKTRMEELELRTNPCPRQNLGVSKEMAEEAPGDTSRF